MWLSLHTAKELVVAFELLAAITGFLYWKKLRSSFWKWFPFYLATIVLVETASIYIENTPAFKWNIYWFKFVGMPLQFIFFTWLFYRAGEKKFGNWYWAAAVLYVLSVAAEELFFKGLKTPFFSFSYMVGCIVLLVHCMLHLGALIRSDELLACKTNLMFWVCLGIIVFYIATFPFYGLFYTLATKKYRHIHLACTWIACFLDYAMYLLFTIGFICYKPKAKL
jgi:hypothetical protein